jgi:RNA polymerase sigma-70 factor (ECF subfamily)
MQGANDHASLPFRDLVARAKAGDQAAMGELFRTHYPKITRVISRRLNRPMRSLFDSTDFASDVFKSLIAKFDRFDFKSEDAFLCFLQQAAEQKIIDQHRRITSQKRDKSREQSLDGAVGPDGDYGPLPVPGHDPTPSQVVSAEETYDLMRARMDAEHQKVLELRREGWTNSEIAAMLNWSVRKVQRTLEDLKDSWHLPGGGR